MNDVDIRMQALDYAAKVMGPHHDYVLAYAAEVENYIKTGNLTQAAIDLYRGRDKS